MHGFADADVGATSADIAGERGIDVGIARRRIGLQQRRRRHDLSRLAIAALRHVSLDPSPLCRMAPVLRQTLDGCDALPFDGLQRQYAGADRDTIEMHSTRATESHAAPILGPSER